MIDELGLTERTENIRNLALIDPLGYLDFLNLAQQRQVGF